MKKYKPITPAQRHRLIYSHMDLAITNPIKKLTEKSISSGGRNHRGKITVYNRGGGVKKLYRKVDFKRDLFYIPGKVVHLEYDPNRTSFLALINYHYICHRYIIAPQELKKNTYILSGIKVPLSIGNALPLKNIPIGSLIHNVELTPSKGGQLVRSAGTYASLMKKTKQGYALLRLSSGEQRLVSLESMATLGVVSNPDNKNVVIGKAGINRLRGKRPVVRGVAMNPIDHPHGGNTAGGRPSVTPWGKPTKGQKTRKNKKNNLIIEKRK